MAVPQKANNSPKPDKLIRDALLIELQTDSDVVERGQKIKKLRLLARKLLEVALEGDVPAIKEINDRVEGKAVQGVMIGGDSDNPLQTEVRVVMVHGDK